MSVSLDETIFTMLAARDQENLAYSHHAGAASKPQNQGMRHIQPKTPGARFPKTPLKVPLNDENTNAGFGGKSMLRTKGNNENIATIGKGGNGLGKSNLVTPLGMSAHLLALLVPTFSPSEQMNSSNIEILEPRTSRAPLGNKTTNAKARAGPTGGGVKDIVREFEKTQAKPTTVKRPKQAAPHIETSRLEIHNDKAGPLEEEDIEYAPPQQKDIPYESDVIPRGAMTFKSLKPENMLRGYYDFYFNPVDENGVSLKEREMEEQRQRDLQRLDERVRKDMDEFDWSVGDVPESKPVKKRDTLAVDSTAKATGTLSKRPSTITSRRAVSALAMAPKAGSIPQPKNRNPSTMAKAPSYLLPARKSAQRPVLTRESSAERAPAVAASRSTLGYSKGRTAVSAIHAPERVQKTTRTFTRTASTASSGSDTTITPARFANSQASKPDNGELSKKLEFLSIFDVDEDDDGGLGGSTLPYDEGLDEEFKLDLGL